MNNLHGNLPCSEKNEAKKIIKKFVFFVDFLSGIVYNVFVAEKADLTRQIHTFGDTFGQALCDRQP